MNNLVKNARDLIGDSMQNHSDIIKEYNSDCVQLLPAHQRYIMELADPWCAAFVSVVARRAGLTPNEFPYGVSVSLMVEWAKARGKYHTDKTKIKAGDLITYDWNYTGTFDHVGVCGLVELNKLEVVEGNYRDGVGVRIVSKDSPSIIGYIAL